MVELREENVMLNEKGWAKDSDVSACKLCEGAFTLTQRKHHCRFFGEFAFKTIAKIIPEIVGGFFARIAVPLGSNSLQVPIP